MSEDKKELEVKQQNKVVADERGMIIGNDLDARWRICKAFAASRMLPQQYDTPEKVFTGIQYAIELGFDKQPITALRNISIINGMPSIWGELPLAMVMASGKLFYIDEYFIDSDGEKLPLHTPSKKIFGAICEVKRNDMITGGIKEIMRVFTQEDKHNLGISAIWNKFEKIMMKRKARAIALKDLFPDVLLGISISEYDYHMPGEEIKDEEKIEVDENKLKAKEIEKEFTN
jgi:hypothetical protein